MFPLCNKAVLLSRLNPLCALGSLLDPSADAHSHHQAWATYDSDDLSLWAIVKCTGEQDPHPAVVHIDMRFSDRIQVYRCKGWNTRPWSGVQGVILGILALGRIPGEKAVESLLGIMQGQGHGNPREGVCKVFPVDDLDTILLGCNMIALQAFDTLEKEDPLHRLLSMADLLAKLVGGSCHYPHPPMGCPQSPSV